MTYMLCRWVAPWMLGIVGGSGTAGHSVAQGFGKTLAAFAPLFALLVLLMWGIVEMKKWTSRRRFDAQADRQSINALDWREFESLLCEAFRRQGFMVEHTGSDRPDGGIDQRLNKAGAVTLVQCKHWKARQVGVKVVRELLGVVSSEDAQSGIVVTSGRFTPEAREFAEKNPIRLIDGRELVRMIGEVRTSGRIKCASAAAGSARQQPSPSQAEQSGVAANEPTCPLCGSVMVRRTAKTGQYAGSEFLGCSRYPACRGIRNLKPADV